MLNLSMAFAFPNSIYHAGSSVSCIPYMCQPCSSSWRDINSNKLRFWAGRRDRKPFPRPRGVADWIRDLSAVRVTIECVISMNMELERRFFWLIYCW